MRHSYLVSLLAVLAAHPTTAIAQDEILSAQDNSEINCRVARSGITRISLNQDRFTSVMRMTALNPSEDFSVVNEPSRGDIYISLPSHYSKPSVSFFGISSQGNVYKFECRPFEASSHQIFVDNPSIGNEEQEVQLVSREESASGLIQAMAEERPLDGYETRPLNEPRAQVGDLSVSMLREYRGFGLVGRAVVVRNTSDKLIEFTPSQFAPGALAVSVVDGSLLPGAETMAYVVLDGGGA